MAKEGQHRPGLFGKSLELSEGDLRFVGGDLALVGGEDNLSQSLRISIETPFATDLFNVNYGFDFLNTVNQPFGGRLVKEYIRLNIIKSLNRDDRVREVRDVIFDDDPRFFEHHPQQNPDAIRLRHQTSRSWQALVLVQTISDGEVTVKLQGTGL